MTFIIVIQKIRFILVNCLRFGSMTLQLEYYLRRKQKSLDDPSIFRIYITGNPVNRQLLEMYKNHLNIYENLWLFKFLFIFAVPFLKNFRIHVLQFFLRLLNLLVYQLYLLLKFFYQKFLKLFLQHYETVDLQ